MRTRRSVIPDSQDDLSFLDTSLPNSSQPGHPEPLPSSQGGGRSRSTRSTLVIEDSEDDRSSFLNDHDSVAAPNPASANIKVVIPTQNGVNNVEATDSSRSSLSGMSPDGATGSTTPATSVSMATGTISNNPQKRVNASARAQQLRASRMSRQAPRGTKRTINQVSPEPVADSELDAALARALQEEEYNQPQSKRRKTGPRATRAIKSVKNTQPDELSDSESLSDVPNFWISSDSDDADEYRDEDEFDEIPAKSTARSTARQGPDSSYHPGVLDDSESEGTVARATAADETILDPPTHQPLNIAHDLEDPQSDEESYPTWDEQRKIRRAAAERKKLEKKHPHICTMWTDLEAEPVITPKQAQQPKAITRALKPFQLEGLNWMVEQEKTPYKGGLLGDEMGMGKTIQAVSLIMSDFPQSNPTLVIVPPVALMQWVSEIKEYTDGKLKVLVYHNSDSKVKNLSKKDLRKYDVVMISYSSLESIYRKQERGWARSGGVVKEDSVIHSIHYHRLILDEAHSIKQRTTSVAKACFALEANYKWCLSGTPVQNRIGEFFSLLRFLQVKPFACYFCKQCSCEQLQWTTDDRGRCTECNHTGFNHVSVFNKEILNPITEGRTQLERKAGLKKLRLITDQIMLRRLKQEHTSSMELPPKRIILHNEFFGEIEHDFSKSIMTNSTRKFDTYVSQGVMLNNYANIFGLIMQMRQVANHPDLILKKHVQPGFNVLVCRVCDEPAEDAIRSRCRHEFCRKCAKDYIQSFDDPSLVDCPQCHIALSIDLEQPTVEQSEESVKKNSIINRILMENWTSSTKIETLLYELYLQRKKTHTPKSIIFSQFTSMLQLVEWRLRHAGFNTVMLDGTMTPAQRQKSIEHFMTHADVEVFLVSLKAGGVALNLTEASRVFIVDP